MSVELKSKVINHNSCTHYVEEHSYRKTSCITHIKHFIK